MAPFVSAQTSALLPPLCIEAVSLVAPAMRASPPGSTRQERGPSETTKTRSITERASISPRSASVLSGCQVGICDSGTLPCTV